MTRRSLDDQAQEHQLRDATRLGHVAVEYAQTDTVSGATGKLKFKRGISRKMPGCLRLQYKSDVGSRHQI